FPSPAPAGPYSPTLSSIGATPAVGVWSLYAYDRSTGGATGGSIAGGWLIQIYPAPLIGPIATQTTPEDKPITVPFTAADFDGVVTNVVATSSDTTIVPNPNPQNVGNVTGITGGSFTFTPAANQNGSVTITLTGTDNDNFHVTRTFTLNVTSVNDAPTQSI